jgi:RNA polymerase alpha subunit
MNTEAIIEKLLQIQDGQILNTPLDDLDLSRRVYRGLWRSRVRTVGDVAQSWSHILKVRNIGERARCEILRALQAWSCSIPNFTTPDDVDREAQADPRTPIEVLHLSPRTYYALKRNRIEILADIYREWDKIASFRNVGPGTLNEIKRALAAAHPSESVRLFADPDGTSRQTHLTMETAPLALDRKDPNRESHPARNDCADRSAADAIGYETTSERLTKKYVITDSGIVVSADLLQAEEPRKSRAERWKNVSTEQVSANPKDYAPKNIFQAIGKAQNKISSPIRKRKKTLDGSIPIATEWLEMSLYLLDKARTSRQVRTINCPICMAVTLSIRFKKHLVEMHPQAFRELKKAGNRR